MTTKIKIIFIIFSLYLSSISLAEEQNYKIIKLVNDQVITNYDLEVRLQLFSFLNKVSINKENIDQYANEMLKVMTDEKLQLEHIRKYKVNIETSEVEKYISQVFINSGQTINDLKSILQASNIDINILKESIKIQLGWNELSGRLFYRTVEVSGVDLLDAMKKNSSLSEEQARDIIIQEQIGLRSKKLLRDLRAEANIENR